MAKAWRRTSSMFMRVVPLSGRAGEVVDGNTFAWAHALLPIFVIKSALDIVIAGIPVLIHAEPRELEILRLRLGGSGPVDKVNDGNRAKPVLLGEKFEIGVVMERFWEPRRQTPRGHAEPQAVAGRRRVEAGAA